MNIAIFCAYFHPHEGGMEMYVQKLFAGLKDINVTIITSNSEHVSRQEKKFGMDIHRFDCWHMMGKTYPVIKFSEYKNIYRLFAKKKFDYVITQTRFFNTSILGCRIAKKYSIPLIHFEHGTKHSPIKNPLFRMFGVMYDHTIGRYIIKNSYKVVGISRASEEFAQHLYLRNTNSLSCIYNSINFSEFNKATKVSSTETAKLKKKLGLKNERVILFVGRIIFPKGIQDLLEATKHLKDVKVIIIGDGNYLSELKKQYPWATYLGNKGHDEIIPYLALTDIFVNPSYAEGLPTSVLEAGAAGLPIIATDVGGTREIIQDGKNGYLIKPKDVDGLKRKLIKLLDDTRLKSKFGKNIQVTVKQNFDIQTNSKKIQKLLRE
jgi:glycosyltransferase involved in cell wall biosynthesis